MRKILSLILLSVSLLLVRAIAAQDVAQGGYCCDWRS